MVQATCLWYLVVVAAVGNEYKNITSNFNMAPGEHGPKPGTMCKDIRHTQLCAGVGHVQACRVAAEEGHGRCPWTPRESGPGGLLVPNCCLKK